MATQKSAPVDRGCAVAVIIFILVLGTLLPWNFFITAMEVPQLLCHTHTASLPWRYHSFSVTPTQHHCHGGTTASLSHPHSITAMEVPQLLCHTHTASLPRRYHSFYVILTHPHSITAMEVPQLLCHTHTASLPRRYHSFSVTPTQHHCHGGTTASLSHPHSITAMEYFDDRLKGTASSIGSTLVTKGTTPVTKGTTPVTKDYKFASWMTLLAQLPLLLFTLANSFLYQRIKEKIRITVSMFSILFLLTAIMVCPCSLTASSLSPWQLYGSSTPSWFPPVFMSMGPVVYNVKRAVCQEALQLGRVVFWRTHGT
ncbi:uncharacterized protein LOC118385628 isoform X6 [Oncorhynchus keta]|uniref:uncharacterized protein LOC118385628 isoform X6 n=1 Tax=Oncorhynchus keta TaxID=8018 RepID=UPI00227C99FC|nr:uncharacterized protein LOC118385628 isoform X6 [Oncorhynchus keta]